MRILKRPGDPLKAGDPLVELDASMSVLAVGKLEKDLALKDNEQAQTRLALQKSLLEIEGKLQTQKLELDAIRAELAENRHLFKEGLISQDKLRQSELTEAKAVIELKQLEGQRDNVRQANATTVAGLDARTRRARQGNRRSPPSARTHHHPRRSRRRRHLGASRRRQHRAARRRDRPHRRSAHVPRRRHRLRRPRQESRHRHARA